jgi:hypothetical protein
MKKKPQFVINHKQKQIENNDLKYIKKLILYLILV